MDQLQIIEQTAPPQINFNFDELKEKAEKMAQQYTSVAVTDDSYMSAKADIKALGSTVNEIEKKRKDLKKQLEAPIKDFDAKCKELEQILKDAQGVISAQTDAFDKKRIDEKKSKLDAFLTETVNKYALRPEYSSKIVYPEPTLTSTLKSGKDDIEAQALKLSQIQSAEDVLKASVQATLEAVNTEITQKLTVDDFKSEWAQAVSMLPDENGWLTSVIREKAGKIKEAEEMVRQKALEEERARQEKEAATQTPDTAVMEPVTADQNPFAAANDNPFASVDQNPFTQPAAGTSQDVNPFKQDAAQVNPFTQVADTAAQDVNPFTGKSSPAQAEQNPFTAFKEPNYNITIVITGPQSKLKTLNPLFKQLIESNGCTYQVDQARSGRAS